MRKERREKGEGIGEMGDRGKDMGDGNWERREERRVDKRE